MIVTPKSHKSSSVRFLLPSPESTSFRSPKATRTTSGILAELRSPTSNYTSRQTTELGEVSEDLILLQRLRNKRYQAIASRER